VEPAPAQEWIAGHLARAQASFAQWSPEAAELAGRLRARPLRTRRAPARRRRARCRPHPAIAREHWTVLVAERRWVLAMDLMVQPPKRWDHESEALELPFRTLELV